jgi:hypothetical protein
LASDMCSPVLIEVPLPKTIDSKPQAIKISLQIPRNVRLTARTSDSSTKAFNAEASAGCTSPLVPTAVTSARMALSLVQLGWRQGGAGTFPYGGGVELAIMLCRSVTR